MKPARLRWFPALALWLSLAAAGAAFGAEPAPPADADAALLGEVRKAQAALREIADLLRRQAGLQETDLLLKRLELKQRGLAPTEVDLRNARAEHAEKEAQIAQLDETAKVQEADLEEREASGSAGIAEERSRLRRGLELERKLLQDQMTVLDQRILDLENQLADGRREIRALEERIDASLGLR